MANRKVSTVLDDHLFRSAKLEALKQQRPFSEVLSEALERYLAERGGRAPGSGVTAESWGIVRLDRRRVDRLIRDEEGLLDA